MSANLYIGLLHWPIMSKKGEEIATSVTNLDIHDIARTSRTFGANNYFIITPIKAQQELLGRILGFWEEDSGNIYNPDRQDALSHILVRDNLDMALATIKEKEGLTPRLAVTGASMKEADFDTKALKEKMELDKEPILLLFGTGWGLPASIIERADFRLRPIYGTAKDGYNHLSVRSAVAIYCDRLRGGL